MPALSTGFPSGPFVDPGSGEITDTWRRYLLTLDARTGGRQGIDASAAIAAEAGVRAAADTALVGAVSLEATRRRDGDATEAAARAAMDRELSLAITRVATTSGSNEAAIRAAEDAHLQAEIDTLTAGSGHVYAPWCTGDKPPQLIGTSDGQTIMCRIV